MIFLNIAFALLLYILSETPVSNRYRVGCKIVADGIGLIYFYLLCPAFIIALVSYFIKYGFRERTVNFAILHFFLLFFIYSILIFIFLFDDGFTPLFG